MTGRRGWLIPWLVPLALALVWAAVTAAGVLPAQILPSPAATAGSFVEMVGDGRLAAAIGWSLWRLALGFAAGGVLGIALGTTMALAPRLRDYLYPTFGLLIYIPVLAWLPLLMLVLGLGETLKIVLIAKAVFVPMTIQSYTAVRDVPLQLVEMGRVNRLRPVQVLAHIVAPAAFSGVWSGLRYAHSRAWAALVLVELLAASEGLGFLIGEGQQLLRLDQLLAALVALAAVAFAIDRLLAIPDRWLALWRVDGFTREQAA